MNKLAIPITMVAVIMVAGIFAFSPVDTATTVHDTIGGTNTDLADLMCQEGTNSNFDGADNCVNAISPEGGDLNQVQG